MQIRFTKMHGLGNDFVVINNMEYKIDFDPQWIKNLANRKFGIGFDQMLVVDPPPTSDVEFMYRVFNADGTEVEHCGNGARCFAVFVRDKGLTKNNTIKVQTSAGAIELAVNDDETVTVSMGIPEFEPSLIPFSAESKSSSYTLHLKDETVQIGSLAIGNPHAVTLVEDVEKTDVLGVGSQIESHIRFPSRVNAGFMQIVSEDEVNLRVYERGVGETLACGSGACAAVVTGIVQGYLDSKVRVHLHGGDLYIQWDGFGHNVMLTGPSSTVFEGTLII